MRARLHISRQVKKGQVYHYAILFVEHVVVAVSAFKIKYGQKNLLGSSRVFSRNTEQMKSSLCILLVLCCISVAYGVCPNSCSGRGKCSQYSTCQCNEGWDLAPDCSQKRCPYDTAWASKATGFNIAHSLAECSNNGLCDRATVRAVFFFFAIICFLSFLGSLRD